MFFTVRSAFRATGLVLLAAAALTNVFAQPRGDEPGREARVAQAFKAMRGDEAALALWLRQMPKGADLHNHLVGAVYAENLLRWAAEDGLCIDPQAGAIVAAAQCKPPLLAAREAQRSPQLHEQMLQSLSMRDFKGFDRRGAVAGHAQFFATFDRFQQAATQRDADMLAEVAERAAANGVRYLELMHSPGMLEAAFGAPEDLGGDWAAQWQRDQDRLEGIAQKVVSQMDEAHARMRQLLACDSPAQARPGCGVQIRLLGQVIRVFPAHQVFAQSSLAFMLARRDARFVGVNLVAPEHSPVTQRDYGVQMHQLGWLKSRWPEVPVSLHAGELTWGLVPPEQLRSNIRQAIEVAGAQRIGHGVSIAHEDDAQALLDQMARQGIAVEINLTSNDVILGVRGARHPLHLYLRSGVPAVLSTDDEGVSRIDLTHEYLRAMTEQGLGYRQLKRMARNSLIYAFVPGQSLWRVPQPGAAQQRVKPCVRLGSAACSGWLRGNAKAQLQRQLEADFTRFEQALLTSGYR